MRVISQDGLIDVPYELTAFHICNGCILMNMAGETGKGTSMAFYSSDEEAAKAMKMLREAYTGNPVIFQNIHVSQEDKDAVYKSLRNSVFIMTRDAQPAKYERITETVFQFPGYDEVSV